MRLVDLCKFLSAKMFICHNLKYVFVNNDTYNEINEMEKTK